MVVLVVHDLRAHGSYTAAGFMVVHDPRGRNPNTLITPEVAR